MLKFIPLLIFLGAANFSVAQMAATHEVFNFEKSELETHLMYLASDELEGRRTTSKGGQLAAEYIAQLFESYGVKPVPGQDGYFQQIPFNEVIPPQSGNLEVNGTQFALNDNLLILSGPEASITAPVIFAGHGWLDETAGVDDYRGLEVEGKIVIVLPGTPDGNSPMQAFKAIQTKQRLASERGATALFELYRLNIPWQFFKNYFGTVRLEIGEGEEERAPDLVYGWIQEGTPNPLADLMRGRARPAGQNQVESILPAQETEGAMKASLSTSGIIAQRLEAANVIGYIEGTDADLKNEYIVLSAHYDHVGIGKQGGAPYTEEDSIFNGARDNGMGTVALMAAAKYLAADPPKRSVILLACTGEEMGMLGSNWFVEHPVVPLEQMVINLNNDGAGYNSTEHVSIVGLERTNVDRLLLEGARAAGLEMTGDPAPQQNLYERSDNISFAQKGIPAVNVAPGITEMNEEIFKYYHQAADNPDTVDYDYLLRFSQAYAAMARLIANEAEKPAWTPGDKFEK